MNLQELIAKLDFFKKELEKYDYIHHKNEFFSVMKEFRKFIKEMNDKKLFEEFYHSKRYEEFKKFFREKNNYYGRAMESVEALSIMTKWVHWWENFMDYIDVEQVKDNYYRKWEDIKSLDFSWDKTMVMVWCWPLPETLIYFYENTPAAKVKWIDNNYEAIYIAWEMISALGMENIQLEYYDGNKYNYQDADIIYIPGFIEDKSQLLNRIAETSKDNVQILVFSATLLSKLLYDSIPKDLHPRLKITQTFSPSEWVYTHREMVKIEKYKF